MDIHLLAGFLIGPTEPLQQRLPPGPVGMHLDLQTLQLPAAVERGPPLRRQRRQRRLMLGDLAGDLICPGL